MEIHTATVSTRPRRPRICFSEETVRKEKTKKEKREEKNNNPVKDLTRSTGAMKLDDSSLVKDMVPEVYKVVSKDIQEAEVVLALRECDYVVSDAVQYLVDKEARELEGKKQIRRGFSWV
jgi:hypothetical protein